LELLSKSNYFRFHISRKNECPSRAVEWHPPVVPTAAAVGPPSLLTLATLAAILIALTSYEALRSAEARDRIRHGRPPPQPLN
jgi:hypothetical protein